MSKSQSSNDVNVMFLWSNFLFANLFKNDILSSCQVISDKPFHQPRVLFLHGFEHAPMIVDRIIRAPFGTKQKGPVTVKIVPEVINHLRELFALARDRGKSIYFEASVGAGIPIIKSLREGLVSNKFYGIFGIVNGTSNFILSQMSKNNCNFNDALSEAKARGFAEKDPTLDIEGIDSAHKLILLTYLCFGRLVKLNDVFIEGISRISLSLS